MNQVQQDRVDQATAYLRGLCEEGTLDKNCSLSRVQGFAADDEKAFTIRELRLAAQNLKRMGVLDLENEDAGMMLLKKADPDILPPEPGDNLKVVYKAVPGAVTCLRLTLVINRVLPCIDVLMRSPFQKSRLMALVAQKGTLSYYWADKLIKAWGPEGFCVLESFFEGETTKYRLIPDALGQLENAGAIMRIKT